ncbi:P-loop containing nucleoside triphosphate hydrolase protein [Xylaria telfairii]|nr:P-loop containing nucleoside triphosphate hydrolase protein [Xylaria telfairii]
MEENMQQPRPSGLKIPTKISKFSTSVSSYTLQEISESQNNARAQYATTTSGMKRNVPAPAATSEAKRKPIGSGYPVKPLGTSTAGTKARGSSLVDLHQPIGTTYGSSRQLSNNSSIPNVYGSSLGPGARPPSRSHTRTRSATRPVRPATSMETRNGGQNNNGTVTHQRIFQGTSKKSGNRLRRYQSTQGLSSSKSTCAPIEKEQEVCSIINIFGRMSLDGNETQEQRNQASSKPDTSVASSRLPQPPRTPRQSGNSTPLGPRYINEEMQDSQVAPQTPEGRKLLQDLEHSFKAIKFAKWAQTPSPTKAPFVNRFSNVTNFIVADIDEKVGQMDRQLTEFKKFVESAEINSVSIKEELESSKKRVIALEEERNTLQSDKAHLKDQLHDAERHASRLQYNLEEQQERYERRNKIQEEDHNRELGIRSEEFKREMEKLEKLQQEFESRCGAEAEARLESLSQDNKELRSTCEKQKRDHEHEVRLLQEALQRRDSDLRRNEEELRKANNEKFELQTQIHGNNETIDRLRKRAEDAEERLSKDKGHLGGQISLLSSTLDLKSERIQTLEENSKKLQADCELKIQSIELAAERQIAEETALLRERLIKEEERRHKLFEQVQELKGNIRVMCRIKPPSDPSKEALIPFKPQWNEIDEDRIDGLTIPTVREDPTEPGKMLPGKPRDFNFERVFDEKCNNGDVFDEISQLVQSVMDGKKVCIFCYGQTGSGKTFTMSKRTGDGDDGVIPRTQGMIFSEMERLKMLGWEYTVEGSYLEVYQDKLYDLLASRHSKPDPLTVDPIGDELKIKGHDFTLLNDAADLDAMIKTADTNRHVAATVKNDRSSRSHSILVLKINGVKRDENGDVIKTRKGTLNLIDLAGSEKPDKDGPPQGYKEGVEINSSLSYLRTVLSSLGQGKTEGVDFRSYTLTQLLRPSLGKGCRTLMFVMVSPLKENENETIRSLEFARDAQKVKMGGNGAARSKK